MGSLKEVDAKLFVCCEDFEWSVQTEMILSSENRGQQTVVFSFSDASVLCRSEEMLRDHWKSYVCVQSNLIRLHMAANK